MPDASRPQRLPRRRSLLSRLLGREDASPSSAGASPAPTAGPAEATTLPGDAAAAPAPPPEPRTPLAGVLDGWGAALAETAGRGVLLDDRTAASVLVPPLDLGGAHPSGLAAFWAGRATRLSSLVRERGAHAAARERVRALRTAAQEVGAAHGVQPGALAVGLVRWSAPGDPRRGVAAVEVHAPALLQPLVLRPRGAGALDEELDLQPGVGVNPELVRVLAAHGHRLDVAAVLAPFADGRGDAHRRATGELAAQTARVPGLELAERTLVGVYPELAGPLVDDLAALAGAAWGRGSGGDGARGLPPLLTALAAASAGQGVEPGGRGQGPVPGRPWDGTGHRLVLDLDEDQERVHDALAAGRSLRVLAEPGTGATQLVAQVVASAAGGGRRCLVVAPDLGEALDVADRLAAAGLGDLLDAADRRPAGTGPAARRADPSPARRRSEPSEEPSAEDVVARARAGARALDVPAGDGLDAGVLATAHALARLAQGPRPPRTPVRLDGATTAAVAGEGLTEVTAAVCRAAALGAFRPEPAEGPWAGAALGAACEVRDARGRAQRVADELLPRLAEALDDLGGQTGLRRPRTAAEVERRLGLLEDVRGTLEDFLPDVYERPLGELVRSLGQDVAWRTRRTAQKVVAEVVRPGQKPADVRTALRRADAERRAWAAEAEDGGRPRVPGGIAGARRALAAATAELDRLEPVLRPTREGGRLREADLGALSARLHRLAEDEDAAGDLPARVDVLVHLRSLGLGDLLADLRTRAVDVDAAAAEVALCVRASSLEEARRRGLLDDVLPGRADALRAEHEAAVTRERAVAAGAVVAAARSAAGEGPLVRFSSLLALPQRVGPLGGRARAADDGDVDVDLVVLLDASSAAVPEAALALARGRQVLVVGDPAGPPPAAGVVGAPAPEHPGAVAPPDAWSATADVLDEHVLRRRHRLPRQLEPVVRAVRGEVADPAGDAAPEVGVDGGHQDRASGSTARVTAPLRATPAPPGAQPVVLRHVEGRGRPAPEGVVHSLDVEVAVVVEVALEQLRRDPGCSLAVVALTRGHARRVADALRDAVAAEPALASAMARASRGGEPFVVTDVARAAGCVRDVLVLTTAFAPTERGRVLSSFGPLDAAGGAAALAVAAAGARRRLVVVTCLSSDALPPDRLRTPGARALRALLAAVEAAVAEGDGGLTAPADGGAGRAAVDVAPPAATDVDLPAPGDDAARALAVHASAVPAQALAPGPTPEPTTGQGGGAGEDPLVAALVERLRAAGALVHRARLPGDPDLVVVRPDGAAVAVLPDVRPTGVETGPSAADPLLRGREAAALGRSGWAVVHVASTALLVDPAGEVVRVLSAARPAGGRV